MKTPREILLARHRAAEPKLDAIREAVVGGLNSQPAEPQPPAAGFLSLWRRPLNTLWCELILPSRRIWTGLGAVWVLLLIVNISQRDAVGGGTGQLRRSPVVMMSWQVQQRWMDELLADRVAQPKADRPRTGPASPRTEETKVMAA